MKKKLCITPPVHHSTTPPVHHSVTVANRLERRHTPPAMSELDRHLSSIATQWTLLREAHDPEASGVRAAQEELMRRYLGAVYRYLLAAVRDYQAADDLTQEFAVRFLTGRYRNANPERGRFRDYVKRCLFHLVQDHRRGQGRRAEAPLPAPEEIGDVQAPGPTDEHAFWESWRSELLARAWSALQDEERDAGKAYYAVLRLRVDHPQASSAEMADMLAKKWGRPVTADSTRQTLKRARERFGELLLAETSRSVEDASLDRIEEELTDLNLLKYCRDAVARRRKTP